MPARQHDWTLQVIGNWSAIASKLSGNNDTPYETGTHNTVNEIASIDPQGAVGSFNLDADPVSVPGILKQHDLGSRCEGCCLLQQLSGELAWRELDGSICAFLPRRENCHAPECIRAMAGCSGFGWWPCAGRPLCGL